MSINNMMYQTPVLKTKEEDFLKLLENLGLKDTSKISNGSYYIYTINLLNTDPSVRRKLNSKQMEFVR